MSDPERVLLNYLIDNKLNSIKPEQFPPGVSPEVGSAILREWEAHKLTLVIGQRASPIIDAATITGSLERYREQLKRGGNAVAVTPIINQTHIGGHNFGAVATGHSTASTGNVTVDIKTPDELTQALSHVIAGLAAQSDAQATAAKGYLELAQKQQDKWEIAKNVEKAVEAKTGLKDTLVDLAKRAGGSALGSALFKGIAAAVEHFHP
jgi:hypothetical protein